MSYDGPGRTVRLGLQAELGQLMECMKAAELLERACTPYQRQALQTFRVGSLAFAERIRSTTDEINALGGWVDR